MTPVFTPGGEAPALSTSVMFSPRPFPVYNPAPWICGTGCPQTQPLRGTMSEIREDNSASRVATYFVFAFLLAAILETLIATLGR
jgi:hypothetical protein